MKLFFTVFAAVVLGIIAAPFVLGALVLTWKWLLVGGLLGLFIAVLWWFLGGQPEPRPLTPQSRDDSQDFFNRERRR